MSTPIPGRRPYSDPAVQPDADVDRSASDQATQSVGAAKRPNAPLGLRELVEGVRAEHVRRRSPHVAFALPRSAPQSQPTLTGGAHATPAPGAPSTRSQGSLV